MAIVALAGGRCRREFGIRVAMEAQPREIRRLVLRDGLGVAIVGLALGAPIAWVVSRALMALA
jgi:ABC-type antimicrobial peptide transport system permease subunit